MPLTSAPAPGSRRLPRALTAAVTAGALALSLTACQLRVGHGAPPTLPAMSQAQSARDAMARQALLVASKARSVATRGTDSDDVIALATRLSQDASVQSQALGGVWQPWPSDAPTDLPTATPLATSAPDADGAALLDCLSDGVAQARQVLAGAAPSQDEALAVAGVAVAWSADAAALASLLGLPLPDAVIGRGRTTAPWEGTEGGEVAQEDAGRLLLAYDAARYAMETVAARSPQDPGDTRSRAAQDADDVRGVVSALVAAGAPETRLPAYALRDDDATWAQEVWLAVAQAEIATAGHEAAGEAPADAAGASTVPGRSGTTTAPTTPGPAAETVPSLQSLDAAIDAVHRATAWGASFSDPLPGLSEPS